MPLVLFFYVIISVDANIDDDLTVNLGVIQQTLTCCADTTSHILPLYSVIKCQRYVFEAVSTLKNYFSNVCMPFIITIRTNITLPFARE